MLRLLIIAIALLVVTSTSAIGGDAAAPAKGPAPSDDAVPAWAKVSADQVAFAKRHSLPVAVENKTGMRFVLVFPGTFSMGSSPTEAGRRDNELQHEVTLRQPYYISIHEVTNAQFRQYRAAHNSGKYEQFDEADLNGDTQPVVRVSHEDAVSFLTWLTAHDRGRIHRLPTEAEWEYACRAGTRTARWWGDDAGGAQGKACVLDPKSSESFKLPWDSFGFDDGYQVTAPVGQFAPNPWGLYDMLGNVWEWCSDWYEPEYPTGKVQDPQGPDSGTVRVVRGGSWSYQPDDIRSARRDRGRPSYRSPDNGFRVAFSAPMK